MANFAKQDDDDRIEYETRTVSWGKTKIAVNRCKSNGCILCGSCSTDTSKSNNWYCRFHIDSPDDGKITLRIKQMVKSLKSSMGITGRPTPQQTVSITEGLQTYQRYIRTGDSEPVEGFKAQL